MANMHGSAANCTSSSSSSFPPSAPITDLDEFSLFLHQIMHKGTNDLQYSFRPTSGLQPDQDFRIQPGPSRIPLSEASPGLNPDTYAGFASTGACLPENVVANVSSSSINSAENELNEYDCESEERLEGVGVEALTRPTTLRNPAKRGRAAEVHNLSEKRRRSRINEKMKALQNLIPNSNKTDKASMLDEAIEYLKQLQLQVQMLTMRNGVSLYPMFLPGVVQSNEASHMRMGYPEGNRPLNSNIPRSIPLERTNPTNILFTIPDHYPNQEQQTPVSNLRELNNSDSFGLETSNQIHPQSYQQPLPGYPKGICLEDPEKLLPSELVNADLSRTNTVGHIVDWKAAASVLFHDQASNLEEACILGRDYESRKILRSSDL